MRKSLVVPSLGAALVALLTLGTYACSSSTAEPPDPGSDAGSDAAKPESDAGTDAAKDAAADALPDAPDNIDCGAILLLPPIVTVESAGGGALACDAIFQIEQSDGGLQPGDVGALCGGDAGAPYGCPSSPVSDGGPLPCVYALIGLSDVYPDTPAIQVAQSGYEPASITGMKDGTGGCAAYVAPTSAVVKLVADVEDAGDRDAGDAEADH